MPLNFVSPRFVCIRQDGVIQGSAGAGTVVSRPVIQLIKSPGGGGNASNGGVIVTTPTTQQQQQQLPRPQLQQQVGSGTRVMRIKETIVRQNGSVVFIAMPSEESVVESVVEYAD